MPLIVYGIIAGLGLAAVGGGTYVADDLGSQAIASTDQTINGAEQAVLYGLISLGAVYVIVSRI